VGPVTSPLTPDETARLRRALLRKGAEINEKLVALLTGARVRVDELISPGRPGETPTERLRRFLALVDGRIKAIAAGTYGRCERCGEGLPFAHLEQVPWIDTCQACAAELAREAGTP
jgi:hypothetical protein